MCERRPGGVRQRSLSEQSQPVELHVVVGTDVQAVDSTRKQLLAHEDSVEVFDLAEGDFEHVLDAIRSPALFGPRRVLRVWGFDQLTAQDVDDLASAGSRSQAKVVATAPKLARKVETAVGKHGSLHRCSLPTKHGDKIRRVRQIAEDLGVSVDVAAAEMLVERSGDDLARVASTLAQLAIVDVTKVSAGSLTTLVAGMSSGDVRPWDVTDHLGRGEVEDALSVTGHCDVFSLAGWVASQLERGALNPDATDFGGKRAAALVAALGPDSTSQLWSLVCEAVDGAKRGEDATGERLVAHMAKLWPNRHRNSGKQR